MDQMAKTCTQFSFHFTLAPFAGCGVCVTRIYCRFFRCFLILISFGFCLNGMTEGGGGDGEDSVVLE